MFEMNYKIDCTCVYVNNCRVNDDTLLITPGWTEVFIDELAKFNPPNIGVVGPCHHGDVQRFMTYEFTHHTHVDMFGFHYPREFMGNLYFYIFKEIIPC